MNVFKAFPHVKTAVIYGSRAKGNFKPSSDIDMTLIGNDLNHTELSQIEVQLDDLLLPYKIDLSLHHQIDNPDLVDQYEIVQIDDHADIKQRARLKTYFLGHIT